MLRNLVTCGSRSNRQALLPRNDRTRGVAYNSPIACHFKFKLEAGMTCRTVTGKLTFAANSISDFTAHHLSNSGHIQK